MQYKAIQCNAIHYNTTITIQYNTAYADNTILLTQTIQYCNTVNNTIQYNKYKSIQYNAKRINYITMTNKYCLRRQHNTAHTYNTMQYNSIQNYDNTIQ